MSLGTRRLRSMAAAVALIGVVSLPLVIASPASARPTAQPVLTDCTVAISPATFGPTDVVSATLSLTPDPAEYAAQVDDGPEFVAVGTSRTDTTSGILFAARFGFSSGSHSVKILGTDGNGTVTATMCSADFVYNGPLAPSFVTVPELPGATSGNPYSASVDFSAGVGNSIIGCVITGDDVPGLTVTPGDLTSNCATLAGTPTTPGTYTVTATISYEPLVAPASVESLAVALAIEPLTVVSTFTLVVEAAQTVPTYTG